MEWQYIPQDQLQVGDIIETSSKIVSTSPVLPGAVCPFVKHYGIMVESEGSLCVLHNPFGGKPLIQASDVVFNGRMADRVLRTNMSNEEIMAKWQQCEYKFTQCKNAYYQFWQFNCEDFVRKMSGDYIGFDQRKGWSAGVIVIVTVIVVLVIVKLAK